MLLAAEKETAEPAGSEAAKFRLWVKSKGLQLAPTQEHTISIIFAALGCNKAAQYVNFESDSSSRKMLFVTGEYFIGKYRLWFKCIGLQLVPT